MKDRQKLEKMDPRQLAGQIIQAALEAVDPARALKNYFADHPQLISRIKATQGRIFVAGAGKAGTPMALAIAELFKDKIEAGLVIVKYNHLGQAVPGKIVIKEAAHPIPDEAGFIATQEIKQLLTWTQPQDSVICLISGGASALLSLPAQGLSLVDLQNTTQALLAAGGTINQVNTIRKHLSAIKGGQLARLAAPAALYTFILSDVVGDPLEVIGSGPTVPDPSTFAEAWSIIEQYQLVAKLPKSVLARLQAGLKGDLADTPKPDDPIFEQVTNVIIGSNRIAALAAVQAAKTAGFKAKLLSTFIEGEAREVGKVVAGLAKGLLKDEGLLKRPACLVMGGETTVTLKGDGQGGRNQELALAAAIALAGWDKVLLICLGTDGTDGPTVAAGAFADGNTLKRAALMGIDALKFLNRNDAYNFFASLDDLIITGPTQTNVNDLTIILTWT